MVCRLGGSLLTTIDRFGGLGRAISVGIKFLGKLTIPLTIATTIFGVAYEKWTGSVEAFQIWENLLIK